MNSGYSGVRRETIPYLHIPGAVFRLSPEDKDGMGHLTGTLVVGREDVLLMVGEQQL